MVVFLTGNLSDGFTAYGPYEEWEDAFADNEGVDGWGMEMVPPSEKNEVSEVEGGNSPAEVV